MKKTKKIIFLSILTSIAIILSIIDKMITPLAFPMLPTAKIGLANIIVLLVIYRFGFKETILVVVIKIIIANLLFGSLTAFIIGGSASFLSFLSMFLIYKVFKEKVSAIGISVVGGFIHIMVQLLVTMTIYQLGDVVMYYGAILVFVSLICSIIIGVIVNKLKSYLLKMQF